MTFQVPYESSPPATPDKTKTQSFWSNISTTPAGPPPSSTNSFTPQGHPPSTVYNTSQLGKSQNENSNSLFTKSGGFNTNDSIFGSSFGSTDFAMPQKAPAQSSQPFQPSQPRFNTFSNGSAFGQNKPFGSKKNSFLSSQVSEFNTDYDEHEEQQEGDEMDEEEEEEEEEDAEGDLDMSVQEPSKRLSFLDSQFAKPFGTQPTTTFDHPKPIYSNPTDAKRPRLDERWAHQSSLRKTKLSPKKASAMPSILHNLASRSRPAAVTEPADMIINTEDTLGRMWDDVRETSNRHIDMDLLLAYTANKIAATWDICADRSGITRPYGGGSKIGPGEDAPNLVKASFLASLLLQIHHPSRASAAIASASNPAARSGQNSMVKAMQRASVATPVPQILLDWLNYSHSSQTNDLQALQYVEPNPTASSNFWDMINATVLRGRLAEAAKILRSADFNYARTALEDGLPQPGYRGKQLQNIQHCINKALHILDSCPGFQDDDWDITGPDWTEYRKQVLKAITGLEEYAEGSDRDDQPEAPVQNQGFQAVNFGFPNLGPKTMSFTQSARIAESRVPWSIYQKLRALYRIILGDPATIKAYSQDWVEATIGLTAWWDGEDDDVLSADLHASTNSNHEFRRSRGAKHLRAVDRNVRDAYLRRLDLAFGSATAHEDSGTGFQVNTLNSLEVGLASVFEGNVQGVLELLQSWSLCMSAAVAEVSSLGGWFAGPAGAKVAGLTQDDLMVLSYGQDMRPGALELSKDQLLCRYAAGLNARGLVENETGVREGWEMALEILSRVEDPVLMKKAVGDIIEALPLDDVSQLDRLVILCSDLGLEDEGRRISELFGDSIVNSGEKFGIALICYARSRNRRKVKSVIDLLISYSLVNSRAYPATEDLDPELRSLIREPKTCLSSIASVDEEAARILQFYLSGYATLRRFYEIRDEGIELKEGEKPRFKPLARRRMAGKALAAVISSAADNIYGGLYDPNRDSAVQVDGLLALLGEALVFVNQPSSVLSVSEQFTILSAIEDLETVTPRVFAQCEECFRSTLLANQSSGDSARNGFTAPSPRAVLKKSVSSLSASTFSLIGSDMLESARSGAGLSVGNSGVLVTYPGDKDAARARGWDWRVGLSEATKGADVLRLLRLGLAKGLSYGALGSV